jgi:SMC interacting uncharacterized protein involved in chromosome segregation
MGANYAALGTFPKADKKNKVYYVNRLNFGFSVKRKGPDGKLLQRTNMATGLPVMNSRGEPEFIEDPVMFNQWVARFNELGYWSVYEVTPNTPKEIADELKRMAESKDHQVMDEKAFIKFSNPALAKHLDETAEMEAERKMLEEDVEKAKKEKTRLEDEINRLKQKAGVK